MHYTIGKFTHVFFIQCHGSLYILNYAKVLRGNELVSDNIVMYHIGSFAMVNNV